MTSLICWIAVDSRGQSAVYLASDSRISWPSNDIWDRGRKVFACHNFPELLGYMGQVSFPSQALSQVQDLIEAGCLFEANATSEEKRVAIFDVVKSSFLNYPSDRDKHFTIVHTTRDSEGMDATFRVFTLSWNGIGWQEETHPVPVASGLVRAWGSGKAVIEKWQYRWMNNQQGGRTSRSAFSAFCDALESGEDPLTGGAPQLVGLYRGEGGGAILVVIYNGSRYVLGVPVTNQALLSKVKWYNSLFECCDGQTMNLLDNAQRHPRPKGLGKAL